MLALVFDGRQAAVVRDRPNPSPLPHEAVVAVHLAGVCSTDLEVLKGYMGFRGVMGHEMVGTVVQGPRAWLGKRVVAEINCPCRHCKLCRAGLGNHCRTRTVLGIDGHDGVFAERLAVPVRNLHEVPAAVTDEQAVFVEPLAAAFQVLRQAPVSRTDRAVVLGDGRLAQLVGRVLRTVARPLMVGRHAHKLQLARKAAIATCLADEFRPAGDADLVVDCTGRPQGLELASRTVRPRGTIILKSTYAAPAAMNLSGLVINEVTVIGSRCGPFADAIKALAAGTIDVAPLISQRLPLADGLAALTAASDGRNLKVLIHVR